MKFFLVRHIATGELLPQFKGRGSTHWNPAAPVSIISKNRGVPKLFAEERRAKSFIGHWARGAARIAKEGTVSGSRYQEYIVTENTDGRKREDLEVIPVVLIIGEPTINPAEA